MSFWSLSDRPWAFKVVVSVIFFMTSSSFAQEEWMKAFSSSRPLDLYIKNFGSFEMTSQSHLEIGETNKNVFEAYSKLTFANPYNIHLERKPFVEDSPLELWHKDNIVKLKMPWQTAPIYTQTNMEISLWQQVTIKEVLDLFEQGEFDDNFSKSPQEITEQKSCFKERRGYLCFDNKYKLPIEGMITLGLAADTEIQTRFFITFFPNHKKIPLKGDK